jgi:hypothetical protein
MMQTRLKALLAFALALVIFALLPSPAYGDDFGTIVQHIETRYHAHRNFRLLMAFAGLTVKMWQGSGVKDVKIAIFENQKLFQSNADAELDELLNSASKEGWHPLVKSISRRRGQRSYIYAQPAGKDLKLLIVNVEQTEAQVIEVKVDPDKLEHFIDKSERHNHEDVM